MLLNKQIGQSFTESGEWDGQPFIDGALFQEELMWLDTMGKKSICIYINCPGGSVISGMNIVNAILKSKTPVDTHCGGVAASMGGVIFMCGRKRTMADYAKLMMHPVQKSNDKKSKEALTNALSMILSSKSYLTQDKVEFLMASTTWVNAEDCRKQGFATDVEATADANKKYIPSDATALMEYANTIIDSKIYNIHQTITQMKEVTNKLGLVEGSNEAAINSAIDKIVEAKNLAEQKAADTAKEKEDAEKERDALKVKLEAAEAKVTEFEKKETDSELAKAEQDKATKATEMVNTFAVKLNNDKAVIDSYVNLAKLDLEGTKNALEALPVNRKATTHVPENVGEGVNYNMASLMNDIANKTAIK